LFDFFASDFYRSGERFLATATFLTQLPDGQDFANPPPGFIKDGRNFADDFKKIPAANRDGFAF
jgi:hypothetical protein